MIRALIVDDEPLARRGIRLRLDQHADIEVAGEAEDGPEAVRMITALLPDLVFLDVQMPGMNGFDVLAQTADIHLPVVIFVTAYDQYAVNAFEVRAIDYLLKPIANDRFEEALRRARRELAEGMRPAAGLLPTRLTVRKGDRYLLVKLDDIDWLEAAANYVEVHARGGEYLIRSTLASLEQRLDPQRFVRIHRSTIVNADRVAEIRSDAHGDFEVTLDRGKVLRMTRTCADRLSGR